MSGNGKSVSRLVSGLLLVLIGSAPLNGYVGFLLWPSESHHDAFTGSFAHLLLGAIPWSLGILLIVLSSRSPRHVLTLWLLSVGLGCFMALPAFIHATDYNGFLGWLSVATAGVALAAVVRAALGSRRLLFAGRDSAR